MSAPKVTIKKVHFVATWTWQSPEEICGICRVALDGCSPQAEYPGDDCPVAWGSCNHAFHLQCIMSWLAAHDPQVCPMCRQPWEFQQK